MKVYIKYPATGEFIVTTQKEFKTSQRQGRILNGEFI